MKKTYFTNDEFAFLDRVKIKAFLKNEIGLLPTPTPPPPPPPPPTTPRTYKQRKNPKNHKLPTNNPKQNKKSNT